MNDDQNVSDPKPHLFKKGHAKLGGRKKKNFTWQVKTLCEEMGISPLKIALEIIASGKLPTAPGRVAQYASESARMRLLEQVLPLLTPKLSSSTVAAAVQVQETVPFDVTQLMKNPDLARAAQTLALGMIDAEKAATQGDRDPVIEADMWRAIDGRKDGGSE